MRARESGPSETRRTGDRWRAGRSALAWVVIPLATAVVFHLLDRTTIERGNRLFRQGRIPEAVEVYQGVLEREGARGRIPDPGGEDPGEAVVVAYNLGTALQALDDAAAVRRLRLAIRLAEEARPPDDLEDPSDLEGPSDLEDPSNLEDPSGGRIPEDPLEPRLRLGTATPERTALHRAHYNLAHRYLTATESSLSPDSAFVLLTAAVDHGRQALLLAPERDDARWNLALAQRRLDSLLLEFAPVSDRNPDDEGRADALPFESGTLTRAESSDPDAPPAPDGLRPDPDNEAESRSSQPSTVVGAREALEGRDPGPLDRSRALEIVGGLSDDPELVVRGILWTQRPDVPWWDATPYPGGDR